MNIFQPGNDQVVSQGSPSSAQQAAAQFKVMLLGQLLNYSGGGKSLPGGLPKGLGGDIGPLLAAMQQPGAFQQTSTRTDKPGATPLVSDLGSLATVLALLNQGLGTPGTPGTLTEKGTPGTGGLANIWDFINKHSGSLFNGSGSGGGIPIGENVGSGVSPGEVSGAAAGGDQSAQGLIDFINGIF